MRGAVIVCVKDQKPEVGLIVRVEQQAWDTVYVAGTKGLFVRFAQGERRINPYTRTDDAKQNQPRVMVLLRATDTIAILHKMRDRLLLEQGEG